MLKGLREIILVWKISKGRFKKLLTSDTGKAGTFVATWFNFIKLALQRRTQLEKIPHIEVSACQLGMKCITTTEDLGFYSIISHSFLVKYKVGLPVTPLGSCAISERLWICLSGSRGGQWWWEEHLCFEHTLREMGMGAVRLEKWRFQRPDSGHPALEGGLQERWGGNFYQGVWGRSFKLK